APGVAEIRTLAEGAGIPLGPPAAATAGPPGAARLSHGLTARELAVLRLLAAGHTNAQIGAELYISPKTAGVHVSNILRKLGVSGRVQAAAGAERAGLLEPGAPGHRAGEALRAAPGPGAGGRRGVLPKPARRARPERSVT